MARGEERLVLSEPEQGVSPTSVHERSLEVQDGGLEDLPSDDIGVAVARRAAVLEVAALLLLRLARDPDRAAPIRHAVRELVDRGRLVRARQAALIALAVRLDVLC